jgi:hypothetical protein
MKLYKLFFSIFLIIVMDKVHGQSLEKSWSFSVNSNIINLQGENAAKEHNFGGPAIGISKHISSGISLGTQFSLGNANNLTDPNLPYKYNSLDGFVKVNILSSSFIPHIILGYGFSKFSDGIDRSGFFSFYRN